VHGSLFHVGACSRPNDPTGRLCTDLSGFCINPYNTVNFTISVYVNLERIHSTAAVRSLPPQAAVMDVATASGENRCRVHFVLLNNVLIRELLHVGQSNVVCRSDAFLCSSSSKTALFVRSNKNNKSLKNRFKRTEQL